MCTTFDASSFCLVCHRGTGTKYIYAFKCLWHAHTGIYLRDLLITTCDAMSNRELVLLG